MRLIWSDSSWEQYVDWQTRDKAMIRRINNLIRDIKRDPFLR